MSAGPGNADPPTVRGTCYGYEISSSLEFSYLREGTGDPLVVALRTGGSEPSGEPLREWLPPLAPSHVRLFHREGVYSVWIDGGGWFDAHTDLRAPRLLIPPDGDPLRREERMWGLPALLCFLARGDLPLHAAAVEVEGRALLLTGPSRFGKTTLAAAFALAGYRVLSEDLVCLRMEPGPAVVPGPAMLRVRRDVADALTFDGGLEVGKDSDRLHVSIQGGRGTCDPVPLGATVLLNEADAAPRLEPVAGAEAVRNLWAVSFNVPTDDDRARSFRAVAELASASPVWALHRRLALEDLSATVECLVERFGTGS